MGRSLNDVLASLPEDRLHRVETRSNELIREVESLAELRRIAGKAQRDIALALNVKQPSISKIEKQTDLYLSTLRNYIEATGGKLDLVVRFPSRDPIHLEYLGDLAKERLNDNGPKSKPGRKPKPKESASF